MNEKLLPYNSYKPTAHPCLEAVPAHWTRCRCDKMFTLRKEFPLESDERITGYLDGRVTLRSNRGGQKIKGVTKEHGWQRVHQNDLAISGMNAHLGGIGVSDSIGKCSPIYLILKPRIELNVHYVSHLLRHLAFSGFLKAIAQTIRFNSADFKWDDLKKIELWMPPLEEQQKIVSFIQQQDRRIRKFIARKRQLVALFEERRTTSFQNFLKRYLCDDNSAENKMVSCLPLRRLSKTVKTGGTPTGALDHHFSERGLPFYTPGDFSPDLYLSNSARSLSKTGEEQVPVFPSGTVMMVGIGATIGKVAISGCTASCNQQINAIVPKDDVDSEYLALALRSLRDFVLATGNYTTLPIINQQQTKGLQIPVLDKRLQAQLVEEIKLDNQIISHCTAAILREIKLINEYRARLIADAVTGKIDLRNFHPTDEGETPDTDPDLSLEDSEELNEDYSEDEELLAEAVNAN